MMYPVKNIAITQGYHLGKSLDFGWWKSHHQAIFSCADGVVYRVEKQEKGGNVIYIKHAGDIISAYGHLNTTSVKVNQKVAMGEKIGTMGQTGAATGEHLHFGLYSKGKNIYGKADLDPFYYCLVYPGQEVCQSGTTAKYLDKIKYYDDSKIWSVGDYKLLYDKYLRKSHDLGNNIYKVKECTKLTQKYLTSTKPNAKAKLKKGTEIKIKEIFDEKGRIWGKMGNAWLVLCNRDGKPQSVKL